VSAVAVTFTDSAGNPLPPEVKAQVVPIGLAPTPANVVASAYIGILPSVTFALTDGAAYRVRFRGNRMRNAPLASFVANAADGVTVAVPGYMSPLQSTLGFTIEQMTQWTRGMIGTRVDPVLGRVIARTLATLMFAYQNNAALALQNAFLPSSVGTAIDSWFNDFLGDEVPRYDGELDSTYIARGEAWMQLPFGTLAAIQGAVDDFFATLRDNSTSVIVFDRDSNQPLFDYYGLTPGMVAIIMYAPATPDVGGIMYAGQSFVGQNSFVVNPYGASRSFTSPYPDLDLAVKRVKLGGAVPVYISSRGEPPDVGTWDVPAWSDLHWTAP
jgi:hypothetical protein